MTRVDVQDARSRLDELLARVEAREDVVIARAGVPVARLVAIGGPQPRAFGGDHFGVPDDFDAALPHGEAKAWE